MNRWRQRGGNACASPQLDLQPGDQLLEIGCSWGGFAEIAARDYGCNVVALTSRASSGLCGIDGAGGLSGHARFDCKTIATFRRVQQGVHRDVQGRRRTPCFETLRERLAPCGEAAYNHPVDGAISRLPAEPEFIQRYLFPGGMLPNPCLPAGCSGVQISNHRSFHIRSIPGETARRWEGVQNLGRDQDLGFDDRFCRMWRYVSLAKSDSIPGASTSPMPSNTHESHRATPLRPGISWLTRHQPLLP